MSDPFEDGISRQIALQPALSQQSQGRPLSNLENRFADALMEIYGAGEHELDAVAKALKNQGVVAPISGKTDWDKALLESELKQINADLDTAYAENGYGA